MVLKGSLGLFGQLGLGGRSGAALGLTHLDMLKETHSPLPRPFLSPFLYKILSYRHKHTGTFMHRIHFHLRFLFQFAFSWLASGGQDSSHLLMPLFLVRIFFPLMQPYKQPLKSEREWPLSQRDNRWLPRDGGLCECKILFLQRITGSFPSVMFSFILSRSKKGQQVISRQRCSNFKIDCVLAITRLYF